MKALERVRVRSAGTFVTAMVARGVGAVSALALSILVARAFGAHALGTLAMAQVLMLGAALLCERGEATAVLRRSVPADSDGMVRLPAAFARPLMRRALLLSGSAIAILWLGRALGLLGLEPVLFGALAGVGYSVVLVRSAQLKSMGRPVLGVASETAMLPVLMILWVLLLVAMDQGQDSLGHLLLGLPLATLVAAFATAIILRMSTRYTTGRAWSTDESDVPQAERRRFFLNQAMLFSGELLLTSTIYAAASQAVLGLYRASDRIASVIAFPLVAANSITMPQVAMAVAASDQEAIRRASRKGATYSTLLVLPMTLVVLAFGERILAVFGDEFRDAYPFLVALALGYTINALAGPAFATLSMSGYQRDVLRTNVAATVVMTLAVAILGVLDLTSGIAIAVGLVMSVQNLWGTMLVRRRLGFWCIPGIQ